MSNFSFRGKLPTMKYRNAFITGASSGIGLGLAKRMARDGVEVVLAARSEDVLESEAAKIRDGGGKARVCVLDVTDAMATQNTLREIDDELDGLDLVVANAGVLGGRWSGKIDWQEHCEPVIGVNIVGFTATVTALTPRMVERKRGHIVGVSSLAGYRGLPRWALYCGSKAYISNFLESLRIDLRKTGVKVTDIRPGFVRTPFTGEGADELPFLIEADEATKLIWKGIKKNKPVVEFPWQVAKLLRGSQFTPPAIYDMAIKKVF